MTESTLDQLWTPELRNIANNFRNQWRAAGWWSEVEMQHDGIRHIPGFMAIVFSPEDRQAMIEREHQRDLSYYLKLTKNQRRKQPEPAPGNMPSYQDMSSADGWVKHPTIIGAISGAIANAGLRYPGQVPANPLELRRLAEQESSLPSAS